MATSKQENIPLPTEYVPEEIERLLYDANEVRHSDPVRALHLVDQAVHLATASGERYATARALRMRAMLHGEQGRIDSAAEDFQKALEQARELQNRRLEAQCLQGLSNVHYYRGEFAQALELIYQCLATRRAMNDEQGVLAGLGSLASFQGALGNYSEAADTLTEALRIARLRGERYQEALTLGNLAVLHEECEDLDQAMEAFEQSVAIFEELSDRIMLPNTLANWATALRLTGRLEEARDTARRALVLAREVENPHRVVTALLSLGTALAACGERAEAEKALLEAFAISEQVHSGRQTSGLLWEIGRFYLEGNQLDPAREYLERALERATQNEEKQDICVTHRLLSDLYVAEGNCEVALEHYKAYHQAELALQRQSAQNRLIAQTARIEVERARHEAEIERLRNVELAEAYREKADLLSRLQEQAARLERLAVEDPLTGLYNRRHLEDLLEREAESSRRTGVPLAVAIADLDRFKAINDRFSHQVGDMVLQWTAKLFLENARTTDVIARYGGEEIVIVMPGAGPEEALRICERIRMVVEAFDWTSLRPGLRVTVSMGIVAEDVTDPDSLLALADARLYRAKRLGRNRVVWSLSDTNAGERAPGVRPPSAFPGDIGMTSS